MAALWPKGGMILTMLLNFNKRRPYPSRVAAMPCQRCCDQEALARNRVQTDLMDMVVCDECAEVAEKIGLPVRLVKGQIFK